MQPVTIDQLKDFAERGLPDHWAALATGWPRIEAAGINTPLRWCHFIAQVAHETGGLRLVRELTRWTPQQMKKLWPQRFPLGGSDPRILMLRGDERKLANLAYSHLRSIGNEGGDDGWNYRGASFLQLTGRGTFRECGLAIGVDLEGEPELIERADIGLAAALWVWNRHPNNQFADHNYGRTIGNAINRGNPYSKLDPTDYAKRQQWLDRAWALWGSGPLPQEQALHLGAWGPKVGELQVKLRSRGYAVGAVDAVLGPATARAIAGFKLDARRAGVKELEPEEAAGPLTFAALDQAPLAPLSPERTGATIATVAATGSTEVATGMAAKALGQVGLYGGATAGAAQLGLLDYAVSYLTDFNTLHRVVVPAVEALKWGTRHMLWVGIVLGGVWCWIRGRDVIMARLRAHQSGANLGR
jgi:putative chitinase